MLDRLIEIGLVEFRAGEYVYLFGDREIRLGNRYMAQINIPYYPEIYATYRIENERGVKV